MEPLNLLVVAIRQDWQPLISESLSKAGYQFQASKVDTKQQALEAVHKAKFDLVISLTEKFWAAMWSLASGSALRIGFDVGIRQPLHFLWRWPSYTHRIAMKNDPL